MRSFKQGDLVRVMTFDPFQPEYPFFVGYTSWMGMTGLVVSAERWGRVTIMVNGKEFSLPTRLVELLAVG